MIKKDERRALAALNFDPAPTADDVWRPSPFNVPELHARVVAEILRGVNKARTDDTAQPMGVAMQGRAGSGKTHLLGAVREKIQADGGYFFLVNLISGRTFWESTALGMVEGLGQSTTDWGTQLKKFLRRLSSRLGLSADERDAVAGGAPLTRAHLDRFIHALRTLDNEVGRECQDTARALVLNATSDFGIQDIGYAHLISAPVDQAERAVWGFTPAVRGPQQIVRDISRLMALALDPSVIAFDQLDTFFAQSNVSVLSQQEGVEDTFATTFGPVADGLLILRDMTRRTLVVMSCLPDTWILLKRSSPGPVIDRFRDSVLPDRIPTVEIGRAIVAKRFRATFDRERFSAPHETWPIASDAFADASKLTPRELLRKVEAHVRRCLDRDEIVELDRLVADTGPGEVAKPSKPGKPLAIDLTGLDARFAELVAEAQVGVALDPATEDAVVPELLAAGLSAWIQEQGPGAAYKHDPPPIKRPALHGRLIQVLNEATEDEAHWAFRAISSPNAVAVQSRIKAACTMAGLDPAIPQRRLILLRNEPWPSGKRTVEIVEAFGQAGGIVLRLEDADLATFHALREMSKEPQYQQWLIARTPASRTALLRAALEMEPIEAQVEAEPESVPHVEGPSIGLGHTFEGNAPFGLNLESLRRHTVIFAGSGSGKTVLIRRLVEECALQGVSSIVLDPNNDLARLGDAWPQPPTRGWEPGDEARAADYLDQTDVVIWTPRISAGRPLTFQPLPDFAPLRDSPDEFDQAVRSTVEALAPRAGVSGTARLAKQGKAVLTEALMWYAKNGNTGLRGFTEFLADLPDGVSGMAKAGKLAGDAAETLKAAMVTDPLFGGDGTAVDPGMLLTPPPGKRARVSVISLLGLTSNEQRQSFVNQLQMGLFAWIKRNPAGDRPLGGLFVMDEAQTLAPSVGSTACTASTIALASQARKYGLGLVFATQAPKGLHNQISGNATTQFFGLLNAPAHIDAAKEMAAAKGARVADIGSLGSGQFYAAGEGFTFVKVVTPLCLTHHPKAPLTPEEVIEHSRET